MKTKSTHKINNNQNLQNNKNTISSFSSKKENKKEECFLPKIEEKKFKTQEYYNKDK